MGIDKRKAASNVEHAQLWFNRATQDFRLFKRLVPFDKKVKKSVFCSDPALAVYLLQQCVEKAVKAAAIASGQYQGKDFTSFYKHNSLALIINLNLKILTKIKELGLDSVLTMMGKDFAQAESKLVTLENQIMGKIPLLSKDGKKVNFKAETISITPELIDKLMDTAILGRKKLLEIIRSTFDVLKDTGIPKNIGTIDAANEFVKSLAEKVSSRLKTNPLSEEQQQAPVKFVDIMKRSGFSINSELDRMEMTSNYLAVWEFAYSLLWLSYITYAHEGTSRYPLKQKGNIRNGKIGCNDYDENLGVVNRIGQLGYATSLILNEMKYEIESVAHFFAAKRH